MPNVTVLNPLQLSSRHLDAWSNIQRSDPILESPFFRPEFTLAVAAVRPDVAVAVLGDLEAPVAFFPFQRNGRVGRPVGGKLSDYQGVIASRGASWDAKDLVRASGLSVWDFDHLLVAQDPFREFHRVTDASPYLELSDGFEAYRKTLRKSGVEELNATLRKGRKLEREVGPVRLDVRCTDTAVLKRLIEWKSAQYRRTRVTDVFAHGWTVNVVERILAQQSDSFAGALSVLYAGDDIVAAHMGMLSNGVLHWWFPAYDVKFGQYSPGRLLLAELAKAAQSHGIRRIDLGRGAEDYKARSMSGSIPVAVGSVDLRPFARRVRVIWWNTRERLKKTPIRAIARVPARLVYRATSWLAFR
jgi:CelD/BcsL family acetyltransferase involved in cellulose biosynthesis